MLPVRDHIPTTRRPVLTWLIIAANVLVFLAERALVVQGADPLEVARFFGVVPREAIADPLAGALHLATSMFAHDPTGWAHLLGNMLFLWIFGDNVEDALGKARFLALYLASGLVAGLAQIAVAWWSPVPLVGASGAISGVLAAYALLYPRSPITVLNPALPLWLIFGPFFELPAWLVVGEYFVVNVLAALQSTGGGGGVAFAAHVAGFVCGALLLLAFRGRRRRLEHDAWAGWRSRRHPPRRIITIARAGR